MVHAPRARGHRDVGRSRAHAPRGQRRALEFAGAQLTEVLRGARALVREELHLDPPRGDAADRDVEEHLACTRARRHERARARVGGGALDARRGCRARRIPSRRGRPAWCTSPARRSRRWHVEVEPRRRRSRIGSLTVGKLPDIPRHCLTARASTCEPRLACFHLLRWQAVSCWSLSSTRSASP